MEKETFPEEKNFECSGFCPGCEKFTEEQKAMNKKERPKEGKQEEQLDKLIKELEKKNKEDQ